MAKARAKKSQKSQHAQPSDVPKTTAVHITIDLNRLDEPVTQQLARDYADRIIQKKQKMACDILAGSKRTALLLSLISKFSPHIPQGKTISSEADNVLEIEFLAIFSLNNPWEDVVAEFDKRYVAPMNTIDLTASELFYGLRPDDYIFSIFDNEHDAMLVAWRLGTGAWELQDGRYIVCGFAIISAIHTIVEPIEIHPPNKPGGAEQSILKKFICF